MTHAEDRARREAALWARAERLNVGIRAAQISRAACAHVRATVGRDMPPPDAGGWFDARPFLVLVRQ